MRRRIPYLLFLLSTLSTYAQDSVPTAVEVAAVARPAQAVEIKLKDKVWFTDRVGTAVILLEELTEPPEIWSSNTPELSILEIDVLATANETTGKFPVVIRFIPQKVGTITMPALTFTGATTAYVTQTTELLVSQPQLSTEMALTLRPAKQRVYIGEPLRLDFSWKSTTINAAELKALKLYPDFFNDPNIEIVIPRNTDIEAQQVGLPIGGRRVIATRTRSQQSADLLGHIDLPIYIRFTTPGTYTLPETRIECARLNRASNDFARYAAHFNNALFESVESDKFYARIYTTAPAIEIEVLPLPANETGTEFSGIFAPVDFEVSLNRTEIDIGQLMQFDIKVSGEAPHGMLDLPQLSYQPGLRERFLIGNEMGRLWHKDGSLFRARLRALSTTVRAFPSLHFLIFDPATGAYQQRSTSAIPLHTNSSNNQSFIPLKSYKGAAVTLTNQPEGIWHNLKANRMNDFLNSLFILLSQNFWLSTTLTIVAFFGLLPFTREQRRRANDRRYRQRADAYKQFRKVEPSSPQKWPAFVDLMAAHFDRSGAAWTLSDSLEALRSINAPKDEVDLITDLHLMADARDFGSQQPLIKTTQLDAVAKRVAKTISRSALLLLVVSQFLMPEAQASDWTEAELLFTQAQAEAAGGDAAHALYSAAAFKFQAAAESFNHPGESWVNSGNAWFQAGSVGRAIAAYRTAQSYRPFDSDLSQNLAAARAMTLNDIPQAQTWWQKVPTHWLKTAVILLNLLFFGTLLLGVRYRHRALCAIIATVGLCLLVVAGFLILRVSEKQAVGAVIVDSLYAKKGPNYAYANAFNEPLHDGTEFLVVEARAKWSYVELSDGRRCWLLNDQTIQFSL